MDCCWWRQHHGRHRLFSWPQLQHSSDWVDQSSYWLQGKLGQIEQVRIWMKGIQQQHEAFWLLGCFFYGFARHPSHHFLLFSVIMSWADGLFFEVPLSNQQLSCVWNCFGRQRAASAQRALMCSMWQLRFALKLKSGSETKSTENLTLCALLQVTGSEHTHTSTFKIMCSLLSAPEIICTVFNHPCLLCSRLHNTVQQSKVDVSSGFCWDKLWQIRSSGHHHG